MAEVITVTALNRYVKALLDGNDLLYDLALRGEVANFWPCGARWPTLSATPKAATAISPCGTASAASRR